jgi:peptide/nickel transport system permease protein
MVDFWRIVRRRPTAIASIIFLVVLLFAAVFAPLLPLSDPAKISDAALLPPSATHWFGTDDLGRDVFSGAVYGARVSLTVGIAAALAAAFFGCFVGAVSGFFGGLCDLIFMRIAEIFQVLPTFLLAALVIALSEPGLPQVIVVIAALSWPQPARLMRGEVLRLRNMDFVALVRCLGIGEGKILLREVVPNAIAPTLAIVPLIIGHSILVEVSLGYLGLTDVDLISWGRMLSTGQRFLLNGWWMSIFPGAAILLTTLAFNILGDAIQAALDPRRSSGRAK